MAKKLPVDVSTFSLLRKGDYIYVDKTEQIYDLCTQGRLYFLSRPRRFGKSLLLSTLSELFAGKRELFKGLWIDKSDYQWDSHPIFYLDLSKLPIGSSQALEAALIGAIERHAAAAGVELRSSADLGSKLEALFMRLAERNRVVVLIDEYDYPLVNTMDNKELAEKHRGVLRSFYSNLKALDEYLRFVFVTGVTKFSKTSLFSGLNNLNDISFDPRAATLLGYTQGEIEHSFKEELSALAHKENVSIERIKGMLKTWYDGYRFSEDLVYVYNPLSVLYALFKKRIANYWFETGAPSFLISLLARHLDELEDFKEIELSAASLGSFEIGEEPLVPILFQAGYLTIRNYHRTFHNDKTIEYYTLAYPNYEVQESFKKYILAAFTNNHYLKASKSIDELLSALRHEDIGKIL